MISVKRTISSDFIGQDAANVVSSNVWSSCVEIVASLRLLRVLRNTLQGAIDERKV